MHGTLLTNNTITMCHWCTYLAERYAYRAIMMYVCGEAFFFFCTVMWCYCYWVYNSTVVLYEYVLLSTYQSIRL